MTILQRVESLTRTAPKYTILSWNSISILQKRQAWLIEELQSEQKQIEQEIKLFMQDSELASNGYYKVSWSNVETTRLDTKRIKQEQPEIYQNYAKVTSSRRFQIKAA